MLAAMLALQTGATSFFRRYEAESAVLTRCSVRPDPTASGGSKVGFMDFDDSAVEFSASVPEAGDYILRVVHLSQWGGAGHRLFVNGTELPTLPYADQGPDYWGSVYRRVALKKGRNTIRLRRGWSFTELDRIELSRGVENPNLPPTLRTGADPSAILAGGWYRMVLSDGRRIFLTSSPTVSGLAWTPSVEIWNPRPGVDPEWDVWAPEICLVRGKYYVYFAARRQKPGEGPHATYVLEADRPEGPYVYRGALAGMDCDSAIDAQAFEWRSRLYVVWSGSTGTGDQEIRIAPMSSARRVSGPWVRLSAPEFDWETRGKGGGAPGVNEGPQVFTQGRVLNVAYSASGSWTNDYCYGMLTLRGTNPLDPAAWTKSRRPVFSRNDANGATGPGHGSSPFLSPDGKEWWHLYHANVWDKGDHWAGRTIRAGRVRWRADGTPFFGAPDSVFFPNPKPSGEPLVDQ